MSRWRLRRCREGVALPPLTDAVVRTTDRTPAVSGETAAFLPADPVRGITEWPYTGRPSYARQHRRQRAGNSLLGGNPRQRRVSRRSNELRDRARSLDEYGSAGERPLQPFRPRPRRILLTFVPTVTFAPASAATVRSSPAPSHWELYAPNAAETCSRRRRARCREVSVVDFVRRRVVFAAFQESSGDGSKPQVAPARALAGG